MRANPRGSETVVQEPFRVDPGEDDPAATLTVAPPHPIAPTESKRA